MAQSNHERQRSPAWRQNVDRPAAWGEEHAWFLEAIFKSFDRDGVWPAVESVEAALADSSPERALAVAQLAVDLPHELGSRHVSHVQLNVRGLSLIAAAGPLLELFVSAMRECRRHYPGQAAEPVVYGDEIRAALDLDDATYRKLSVLIHNEGWFFNGGSGGIDGNWDRKLAASILLIDQVGTVQDYLDAVAAYRFGPPYVLVEVERADRTPVSALIRWFGKRDLSAGDLLLIGVVGSVIAGVAVWLLTG